MELNDNITCILTEYGAEVLNKQNKELDKLFPKNNLKTDYVNGDIYETQLWCLFELFGGECYIGGRYMFSKLEKK